MKLGRILLLAGVVLAAGSSRPAWAAGVWVPLHGDPSCEVWNDNPQPDEAAIWSGACIDGRVTGAGTMVWRYMHEGKLVEARYDGTYIDGREQGKGTFHWANGDHYVGGWRDGRLDGEGIYTFSDGRTCAGHWQFGMLRAGTGHDGTRVRKCRIGGAGLTWLEH